MPKREIDPLRKALKAQSTHKAIPTRRFVYEQLGISKPGFWADWKNRLRGEPEEEYEPLQKTAPQYEALQPYEPREYDWGKPPPKKQWRELDPMDMGAQPQGGSKGVRMPNLAANLRQQSKHWFASNRTATAGGRSISAMDVGSAQRAVQMGEIADMLEGKNQQLISHEGLKSVGQYYAAQATERAEARARIPFGHGLPTQFEEMQAALARSKPVIKGNTGGKSVLQMQQEKAKQQVTMATPKMPGGGSPKPQLNVKQNGYASSYAGFHW